MVCWLFNELVNNWLNSQSSDRYIQIWVKMIIRDWLGPHMGGDSQKWTWKKLGFSVKREEGNLPPRVLWIWTQRSQLGCVRTLAKWTDMYILGRRRYIYTCKEDSGWQTRNENNNNKYKSAHWAVYRGAPMSTKNRRRSTDLDFTGINVAITIIKKRVISPKISFFCSICTRYVGNSGSASGQGI